MKGIFSPYVLWPLDKKLIFWIITRVSARDYTVINFMSFSTKSLPAINAIPLIVQNLIDQKSVLTEDPL